MWLIYRYSIEMRDIKMVNVQKSNMAIKFRMRTIGGVQKQKQSIKSKCQTASVREYVPNEVTPVLLGISSWETWTWCFCIRRKKTLGEKPINNFFHEPASLPVNLWSAQKRISRFLYIFSYYPLLLLPLSLFFFFTVFLLFTPEYDSKLFSSTIRRQLYHISHICPAFSPYQDEETMINSAIQRALAKQRHLDSLRTREEQNAKRFQSLQYMQHGMLTYL